MNATACNSIPEIPDDTLFNDYYVHAGEWLQIQGFGSMPSMRQQEYRKDGSVVYTYHSVQERREVCLKEAILNAHGKWLGRLGSKESDPKTWQRELQAGTLQDAEYADCLNEARQREYFLETVDTCRVVMIYECLPEDY